MRLSKEGRKNAWQEKATNGVMERDSDDGAYGFAILQPACYSFHIIESAIFEAHITYGADDTYGILQIASCREHLANGILLGHLASGIFAAYY
jgi:hypothetical protein